MASPLLAPCGMPLHPLVGSASHALVAGRAASAWTTEMARVGRQAGAMRPASSWAPELALLRLPLREGPLLGSALEVLIEAPAARPGEEENRGARGRRPTSPVGRYGDQRGRSRGREGAEPRSSEAGKIAAPSADGPARPGRGSATGAFRERAPLSGPSRAGQALLHRLAGQAASVPVPPSRGAPARGPARGDGGAPPRQPRNAPVVDPHRASAVLGTAAAERIRASLAPRASGRPERPAQASPGAETRSRAGGQVVPPVALGWASPLEGPAAPRALLEALRREHTTAAVAGPGIEGEPADPGPEQDPDGRRHRRGSSAPDPFAGRAWHGASDGHRSSAQRRSSGEDGGRGASAVASELGDHGAGVRRAAAGAHAGGTTAPGGDLLGVEPGPFDEDRAEEELADLATKLKRILDEEARRHGVDV